MFIITSVTHPASGLPSKSSWLPTVKEVSDACEAALAPIAAREAREERIKEQLAERERFESELRRPRPTYDQLIEKYGPNFGLRTPADDRPPPAPAPTPEQLRAHYAKHDLGCKPKTKIWNETEEDNEF
jgi:hypothetical protein